MSSADKVCMVCGDKALGYNFNAVTCESCKAFFRRNALLSKDFTCPFSATCEITIVTRRFCQRCRLEKCFRIGMQKEYIMSEEDKMLKRKKIEQNRAKRKSKNSGSKGEGISTKIKKEADELPRSEQWAMEAERSYVNSSPCSSYSEHSTGSTVRQPGVSSSSMSPDAMRARFSPIAAQVYPLSPLAPPATVSSSTYEAIHHPASDPEASLCSVRANFPTKHSSAAEIVSFLLDHPRESDVFLKALMPNQHDALEILSKIIHSQKDAMRFIGHFIGAPGDALKIIAKLMDSPVNALNVFTKFMCSPTDALELIAKCVNSPAEVLHFVRQLMSSPESAMETLNRFLSSPAEAMKMLNDMVNTTFADSTTKPENAPAVPEEGDADNRGSMIKSLIDTLKADPQVESAKCEADVDRPAQHNSLESVISDAINMEYNLYNREANLNRELNDAETAKLNELIVAYKALFVPLDEDITPLVLYGSDVNEKVAIALPA